MENYSYSSYPDSRDSSPRSREIDSENQSWDEPLAHYKVKFMCSYGGKIQPRQHDNQLAYVGGDTKILAVERNIKFSAIMAKLSALYCDDNICFKYQLPGEDLDALISVTNDEDLEHMMLEYDRLYRASAKPARLRLFLFTLNPKMSAVASESKFDRQWFLDSLNSVQIQTLEGCSPSAALASVTNPDFLFGFDKPKFAETVVVPLPEVVGKDVTAGSDCGSEDRQLIGDQLVEIQRQELQRLNISGLEQANQIPRASYARAGQRMAPPPGAIPMPMQMQIPSATYLTERQMTAGNYPTEQQQVYLIPANAPPPGLYPASTLQQPASQAYYGAQRVVQEQPMYNLVSAPAPVAGSIQQHGKIGGYGEGVGVVQVGYDGAGRQFYYTTSTAAVAAPAGGVSAAQYQAMNQDGKGLVNAKPPQTSSF